MDVLCPYCLEKLSAKKLEISCPLCGTDAKLGAMDMMMHRFPKCTNSACHNALANETRCGFCGASLPTEILSYQKYLRFSVLGTSGSGKTNFLTTMLHELRNTPRTPVVLLPMDTRTATKFREYEQRVYENRSPAGATDAGKAPEPQLWKVSDRTRMTANTIPAYSMTIFDGAGEDVENIRPTISRYMSGSKGLVILIDPLTLPGVKATVSQNLVNWSTTADRGAGAATAMVDGLIKYIRQSCGIDPRKRINRDVAVVFTKMDLVKDSFGAATVTQPSPHVAKGGFVKADSDAVDAEIRDWLHSRGESAFVDAIETNFSAGKVRFFGISSFGQPPTGNQQLGKVTPHRVLDPLMWMLSLEGIVPIK